MSHSPTNFAEQTIGHVFRNPALLDQALTHKSHVNEAKHKHLKHNERLEFLGDAVLTLVISEHLAMLFPESTEGDLSKLKARLVSEVSLATASRRLDLGALLRLGRGEELTQGREKPSILANTLEAVVAAIYLDGGLEAARRFVLRIFTTELQDVQEVGGCAALHDYKTRLQEWCQKEYDTLPHYVIVRETGPDHQKTFEVQLTVRGDVLGVGMGRTKKEAEQMAAKQALAETSSKH
jgi:ribonuclease III